MYKRYLKICKACTNPHKNCMDEFNKILKDKLKLHTDSIENLTEDPAYSDIALSSGLK